jgi:putative transposase
MPQSLSNVILHIIFSTKNREPWLESNVRPRVHAYLATICRDLGAELVRVGGVVDHVQIVTTLPRTVSQAQLVEQIKKASSKWIKALDGRYRGFFWQRRYGAFSATIPGALPQARDECCAFGAEHLQRNSLSSRVANTVLTFCLRA